MRYNIKKIYKNCDIKHLSEYKTLYKEKQAFQNNRNSTSKRPLEFIPNTLLGPHLS